jgi:hypothetical protein
MHRYLPGFISLATHRITEISVNHRPRAAGRSKYGLGRIGLVMIDLLTLRLILSSGRNPLRWFGFWSIAFLVVAVILTGVSLARAVVTENWANLVTWELAFLSAYLAIHSAAAGFFAQLVRGFAPESVVAPLASRRDRSGTWTMDIAKGLSRQ